MGSPFKMNPKTPLMKALVGKQGNLPEQLKQAILDAPDKSYGTKDAAMKMYGKKDAPIGEGKSKPVLKMKGVKALKK